jgi:deoxyribodipyrimidine photo-lyase
MSPAIVVWWVKRDARLADNAPLVEAARMGAQALPFFCFEPTILSADDHSAMHVHAQCQALGHLRRELRRRSADLLIAHGEIVEKLEKLRGAIAFTHLFSHEEIGNDLTFRRDQRVAAWCQSRVVVYREFPQSSVRRTGVDRDCLQVMWQSRIVKVRPLEVPSIVQSPEIARLASKSNLPRFDFPVEAATWQPVTESDAARTLDDFLDRRGLSYRGGISSPNTAFRAGSRLSVHLAWGTLTAKQVWHATQTRISELADDPRAARWQASLTAFLSRLHWRDHFTQRLESEPALEFRSVHPAYRDISYENDERLYRAWRDGTTGYPMVDAVMRCLAASGFVNFRMRAMVVSFACHALHLDWRMIHPHLAGVFRDYDPGIHLSQLQMQAGVVGWTAIRVYNPAKQLADWDSHCCFVKRWVPELKGHDADRILHADSERLVGYPPPIIAFAPRTKRMKDILYMIRKSAAAQAATPAVYAKHGSRMMPARFPARRRKPASARPNENVAQRRLFD